QRRDRMQRFVRRERVRGNAQKNSKRENDREQNYLDLTQARRDLVHDAEFGAVNVFQLKKRSDGSAARAFRKIKMSAMSKVAHGQIVHGVQTVFSLLVEMARYHGNPCA